MIKVRVNNELSELEISDLQKSFPKLKNYDKFASNRDFLILTYNDDIAIGYAIAYIMPRIDFGSMMMLYEVEVKEQYFRRGAGRAMVEMIIEIAKKNRCKKCFTITSHDNESAQKLYKSCDALVLSNHSIKFVWNL